MIGGMCTYEDNTKLSQTHAQVDDSVQKHAGRLVASAWETSKLLRCQLRQLAMYSANVAKNAQCDLKQGKSVLVPQNPNS